jgi:hypothetical protein
VESIVVFAKTPAPGRVKTRLGGRLAPSEIVALAGAFLTDLVAALQLLVNTDIRVALPDGDSRERARAFVPPAIPLVSQGPGDLGERLSRVIASELAAGATAVAVVGSDHPTLPAGHVRRCLAEARRGRAGWVPADDGGFAALALARPEPELFAGVPWSTEGVAEAVRRNARRLDLELVDCGTWYDVDTPEDLDRLAAELARDPARCPATRAVLDALDPPLHDHRRRNDSTGGER